jgi:hypothetical protein
MLDRIVRAWSAVKRFYTFLLPIRFTLLALLVVAAVFLVTDQGWDILRALAEDRVGAWWFRTLMLLLSTNLMAYAIWFWSRHLLRYRPAIVREGVAPSEFAGWTKWLPRVMGVIVFVVEIAGFLIATRGPGNAAWPFNLWVILASLVASAILYWIVVVKRRDLLGLPPDEMYDVVTKWSDLRIATKRILVVSLLMELALFIWATIDPVSWWTIGVAAALVLTIAVWIPLGSFLVAAGEKLRIPILTILLLWAFGISSCTDNHRVRTLEKVPPRDTLEQAFQRWETRMRAMPQYAAPDAKIPVIVVAAQAGGIRASYWTATVLASLQDRIPSFADHCFAISAVSGGSYGAVVFDALLARRAEGAPPGALHAETRKVLEFDALSGTLAALAQPDLAQRFLPFGFPDRAKALEEGWEYGWAGRFPREPNMMAAPLVATLQKHPGLPSLMLNGTFVEAGTRVITSNVALHGSDYFRNAHDSLEKMQRDLRMSTAALMSARFPYVSPAGTMTDGDEVVGRVVDGGYFEMSGAVAATELLAFLRTKPNVQPFVIYIDYRDKTEGRTPEDRTLFRPSYGPGGPPWPSKIPSFATEAMSPVRGLLNTELARGDQAVGDLVQVAKPDLVEFRLLPRFVPLPLGWVLSQRAQDSIDWSTACEGGNRAATERVAQHLRVTLAPGWQNPTARTAHEELRKYANAKVPCGP